MEMVQGRTCYLLEDIPDLSSILILRTSDKAIYSFYSNNMKTVYVSVLIFALTMVLMLRVQLNSYI